MVEFNGFITPIPEDGFIPCDICDKPASGFSATIRGNQISGWGRCKKHSIVEKGEWTHVTITWPEGKENEEF